MQEWRNRKTRRAQTSFFDCGFDSRLLHYNNGMCCNRKTDWYQTPAFYGFESHHADFINKERKER